MNLDSSLVSTSEWELSRALSSLSESSELEELEGRASASSLELSLFSKARNLPHRIIIILPGLQYKHYLKHSISFCRMERTNLEPVCRRRVGGSFGVSCTMSFRVSRVSTMTLSKRTGSEEMDPCSSASSAQFSRWCSSLVSTSALSNSLCTVRLRRSALSCTQHCTSTTTVTLSRMGTGPYLPAAAGTAARPCSVAPVSRRTGATLPAAHRAPSTPPPGFGAPPPSDSSRGRRHS